MWLNLISSRVGIGFTSDMAVSKAKFAALHGLNARFNAAELLAVTVKKR